MTEEEILSDAKDKFKIAAEREDDTRVEGLDDLKFARLGEQWPVAIRKDREKDGRPCLTINKLPTFIRQVVNDVRQNKPGIIVHPADDGADEETAEIFNGLIRNIQVTSDADVATDTAAESAVSNAFGYFRIDISEDGKDIAFGRIANPFSVYGDPYSEAADSADWNCCFVASMIPKDRFEDEYKDAEQVDWEGEGYTGLDATWMNGDEIMVAEYWHREKITIAVLKLSDGSTVDAEQVDVFDLMQRGITITGEEEIASHKVTQYIMTGAEILETNDWPGTFIPIIPVYGDEINVEGKRVFRSLINSAKDAQRMHNYWRTMATELVALAPKAPFIGEEGSFISPGWNTANQVNHPYLEYAKGTQMPQRQPFAGVPAGALQEALSAADDMKAIIGIYDASLGARSNETSGKAIMARQREGDVSTFHFIDNLSRAIRHAGRILIDLIPKVYNAERIIRILGEDMKPRNVQINPQAKAQMEEAEAMAQGEAQQAVAGIEDQQEQAQAYQAELAKKMQAINRIYDLTAGKYDLIVKSGPSYTSQREETRTELIEIIRSVPDAAPILGPMYLRHSDWPGAEDAADKLEQGAGQSPESQAQIADMQKQIESLQSQANEIEAMKGRADLMRAEAELIRAQAEVAYAGQVATNPMMEVA